MELKEHSPILYQTKDNQNKTVPKKTCMPHLIKSNELQLDFKCFPISVAMREYPLLPLYLN